ncbi:MAG: hypothetical protein U9R75_01870, partial [Candidatus Thermoplasmatota archaeon]|nr:hypothetical protein [Candidatus Thermoplasmatota archaeon]
FADGAMYTKPSRWSSTPEDVVRTVGSKELPSKPLVEYALTTPGIHTAIIGIGQISDDNLKCQLVQNYYASQIKPDGMSKKRRAEIEEIAGRVKDGETNWFQLPRAELSSPNNVKVDAQNDPQITWDTAFAADAPLSHYEVIRDGNKVASVEHKPQITKDPFMFKDNGKGGSYQVVAVDMDGNRSESETLMA